MKVLEVKKQGRYQVKSVIYDEGIQACLRLYVGMPPQHPMHSVVLQPAGSTAVRTNKGIFEVGLLRGNEDCALAANYGPEDRFSDDFPQYWWYGFNIPFEVSIEEPEILEHYSSRNGLRELTRRIVVNEHPNMEDVEDLMRNRMSRVAEGVIEKLEWVYGALGPTDRQVKVPDKRRRIRL